MNIADACVPLELTEQIDPWGIRPLYFKTAWVSDFYLVYADGKRAVRELVRPEDLKKQAVIERLELSRRYWMGGLPAMGRLKAPKKDPPRGRLSGFG